MEKIKVSIITVTFNAETVIEKSIKSIISQDYENKEIIIADDCSTDGTQEMLLNYLLEYPNLFVLKLAKKNLFP